MHRIVGGADLDAGVALRGHHLDLRAGAGEELRARRTLVVAVVVVEQYVLARLQGPAQYLPGARRERRALEDAFVRAPSVATTTTSGSSARTARGVGLRAGAKVDAELAHLLVEPAGHARKRRPPGRLGGQLDLTAGLLEGLEQSDLVAPLRRDASRLEPPRTGRRPRPRAFASRRVR